MITIELEKWQVKNLREYFGRNDKTQLSHWAYIAFDEALNAEEGEETHTENTHKGMEYQAHIDLMESILLKKTQALPRAILGGVPEKELFNKANEIYLIREIIETLKEK